MEYTPQEQELNRIMENTPTQTEISKETYIDTPVLGTPATPDTKETLERVAITLPDVSLPDLTDWNEEAAGKIEKLAELMNLKTDYTAKQLYNKAKKAVKAAETLQQVIKDFNRGQYNVTVKTPDSVVKMDWHDRLAVDVKLGRTVTVRGPAGNGKTLGAGTVLKALGFTVYEMDCTDSTTAETLIGGLYPVTNKKGMSMEFRDGIFSKAFKDPKAAILLNEFDALDPRIGMVLQSALHRARQGGKRVLSCPDHPDGTITAAGECPIVVTMNTWGGGATREYVGRNAIDAASMDRFDSIIDTNYDQEIAILTASGYTQDTAKMVVDNARDLRNKIDSKNLRIVLSTRRLLNIAETMEKLSIPLSEAYNRDFYTRLEPMDREALGIRI